MPVLMSTPTPPPRYRSREHHRIRVMSCSPQERMRLRPWLEKKIEERSIPGLEWIDEHARIVKIPWKHAARHGWTRDKDASLFKEWAIHTKKYDPTTDEPKANPKIWKANFRCAINSLPDIEELKDQGRSKGNDAFKVYRLNPKKPKKTRTVSETSAATRKPKSAPSKPTSTKPSSPGHDRIPSDLNLHTTIPSSTVSIHCANVNVNVIAGPTPCEDPPAYQSVIRERGGFHEPPPAHTTHGSSLPPVSTFHLDSSYPNSAGFQHPTTLRIPPIFSTHHVPCSTTSSPTSTPVSTPLSTPLSTPNTISTPVTSPVFVYPPCAPFNMPSIGIKEEHQYLDEGAPSPYSDSSDMTDEELVDMVHEMRQDSPLNSPRANSSPSLDAMADSLGSTDWQMTTDGIDNKQFFSNIVSTKPENTAGAMAGPSYQPAMGFHPSLDAPQPPPQCFPSVIPQPVIKQEDLKSEECPTMAACFGELY